MTKVYLAGGITGLTFEEANAWRDQCQADAKRSGLSFQFLNPLRGKGFLKGVGPISHGSYDSHSVATSKAILRRDMSDVRRCDALLVNFDLLVGTGTLIEIGAAHVLGKPVFAIAPSVANPVLTDHVFITEIVHSWQPNTSKAIEAIALFLGE